MPKIVVCILALYKVIANVEFPLHNRLKFVSFLDALSDLFLLQILNISHNDKNSLSLVHSIVYALLLT